MGPENKDNSSQIAAIGLSTEAAARQLAQDGPNQLPHPDRRRVFTVVADVFREPMVFLLFGCGAIYFVLGDRQEAFMLLGFLTLIVSMTIYQEVKTEKSLEALQDLSSPRALVMRSGKSIRIAGQDVVRGDLVLVGEGDKVPADGQVVASSNLAIDESLLTGEPFPAEKEAQPASQQPPQLADGKGDTKDRAFAGTVVVKGQGAIQVTHTGTASQLGKIGQILVDQKPEATRLEAETRHVVKVIAGFVGLLCLLVVLAGGLLNGSWMDGLLSGMTLAMAILPNEMPAVLAIFMAIGALSLSRKRILTRRTAAVEALGTTTVLCVDKTGTLTYNQMTVTELFRDGQTFCLKTEKPTGEAEIPEAFHELLEYAALATDPEPFDPMDRAFTQVVSQLLGNTEHVHPEWQLVKRYPLAPELMARSNVWSQSHSAQKPVATKGSPEAIFDLCHLQVEVKAVLEAQVKGMAGQGLRVLGVAKASRIHGAAAAGSLPDSQHDFEFEFLGLVGLEDPIRAEVPAAIARCQKAGIRVMMITGDYPDTARALGQQAGLHNAHKVLTGKQLEGLSAQELKESIRDYSVCARMKPTQKSQLVSVLKSQGDIVAMTGDGVNDAPALKIAHIGIAMGKRGTDVAREASSLVLLDDDFGSMVEAIHIGRRIYDNLSKTMVYLLSVHVPIAGLAMIPIFSGAEAVMLPVHVAFLHLIIEPVCSVVFARMPGPTDLMERMPRPLTTKLFSQRVTGEVVSLGGFTLLAMMGVFFYGQSRGYDLAEVRSLVFATLLGANSALIFRQMHEGFRGVEGGFKKLAYLRPWLLISLGSVLLLLVLIYTKAQSLFLFGEPRLWHVFASLILGGAAILCTKLLPFNLNSAGKSPKIIVSR